MGVSAGTLDSIFPHVSVGNDYSEDWETVTKWMGPSMQLQSKCLINSKRYIFKNIHESLTWSEKIRTVAKNT